MIERKKLFYCFIVSILIIGLSSCIQNHKNVKSDAYSFFVAGHSSGFRWIDNKGLHPPFRDQFDLINERSPSFGVLLGDIVYESTEQDWKEVDSVLQYLNCTTYFAVGNHDITDRELYEIRYGKTYFSFNHEQDLCIVLDPNIDNWNISGEQLKFLKQTIENKADYCRNIFVFFHQLLWWDNNNKYNKVQMNSKDGRADKINFLGEVMPLFKSTEKPVFMFAGDVGAHWTENYFYDTDDNITYIATGMGNDTEDNFIFVNVNTSGKVSFNLISLMGNDTHSVEKIEDYVLPQLRNN